MSSQKSNISEKQQLLNEIAELKKKLALVESRIAILDSESEPAVEPVADEIEHIAELVAPVVPLVPKKKSKSKSVEPKSESKKSKSKSPEPVEVILPELESADEVEIELVAESVDPVEPKKAKSPKAEKAPKAEKKSGEMTMQQLKNTAKDLDVKGYTTLSREQLECVIKIPTITFNAKKLTKWIDTIKEDQTLILFVSNGDLGFSIKENLKNIFFADRCNTKEKNFNEVHSKRFLQGDDDIVDMSKKFINTLKETLKECNTSYFLSVKHFDDEQIKFYQSTGIPTLKDIN